MPQWQSQITIVYNPGTIRDMNVLNSGAYIVFITLELFVDHWGAADARGATGHVMCPLQQLKIF